MVMTSAAQAAVVNRAWLNVEKETISLDLVYSGGCIVQPIKLNVDNCSRSNPMTCVAHVETADNCRSTVTETVEVSATDFLNEANLKQLVIVDEDKNATVIDFSDLRI